MLPDFFKDLLPSTLVCRFSVSTRGAHRQIDTWIKEGKWEQPSRLRDVLMVEFQEVLQHCDGWEPSMPYAAMPSVRGMGGCFARGSIWP